MKVGDKVLVIAGANKGKTAKIVAVDRKKSLAMLEGIGVVERHMKRTQFNPQGGKKTVHLGIDFSNLKLAEADAKSAAKKPAEKKPAAKTAKKGAK